MRDVSIIGIGDTVFGELWDKSFREIAIEAGLEAINDCNLSAKEIDALYVGNMSAGSLIQQEHVGALIADYSGLARDHKPGVRIEAGGASGGMALAQGYMAVASGMHDFVMVGGVEKMTDIGESAIEKVMMEEADQEWESVFGATFAGLHAIVARLYMKRFGVTKEELASVPVKNHKNGSMNPKAHFRREIKLASAVRSPMVADPLGMFDCAPISDGGAAVILCPSYKAKKFVDTPVQIIASGQASDTLALHNRRDITTLDSTVIAGKRAYAKAKVQPEEIDLAEVHDNYSIMEALAIEDLQFFPKGQGAKKTAEGETAIGGKVAINTSGGLKARGQPIGAIGIAQAVEVVRQLRGEAGERQVDGAEVALSQNVGGTGATSVVHLYRREN